MPSKTRFPQEIVGPAIGVVGRGIRYSRADTHLCCRMVVVRRQIQKRRIALTEFWTGDGCRCMCFSQIEANLTNLASGEYEITVYSAGVEPITGRQLEPKVLLTQKVRIP